jgi:hypothetical protein
MISDPDREVVKSAITALGNIQAATSCQLATRLLSLPGEDLQDSLRVAFLNMGESAVVCLTGVLETASGEPLTRAIYLLGKLKAAGVTTPSSSAARPEPGGAPAAAIALTEIGDPRAEGVSWPSSAIGPGAAHLRRVGLTRRISIRLLASLNDPRPAGGRASSTRSAAATSTARSAPSRTRARAGTRNRRQPSTGTCPALGERLMGRTRRSAKAWLGHGRGPGLAAVAPRSRLSRARRDRPHPATALIRSPTRHRSSR